MVSKTIKKKKSDEFWFSTIFSDPKKITDGMAAPVSAPARILAGLLLLSIAFTACEACTAMTGGRWRGGEVKVVDASGGEKKIMR